MSHCTTSEPYTKQNRLQSELVLAETELKQVKTSTAKIEARISRLEQHGITYNILLDAPVEIIVTIMKCLKDKQDIMALYDATPRMKAIFKQNNLAKYFVERDYPKMPGYRYKMNLAGFFYSGKTHESVEKTTLPAGKYFLGWSDRILPCDISENVIRKRKWNEDGGVYVVRNFHQRSGKFVVYNTFDSNNVEDNEGRKYHQYHRSSMDYFACVPTSLARRSVIRDQKLRCGRIINSILPIKCTFTKQNCSKPIHCNGTIEWNDGVQGIKTLEWKSTPRAKKRKRVSLEEYCWNDVVGMTFEWNDFDEIYL